MMRNAARLSAALCLLALVRSPFAHAQDTRLDSYRERQQTIDALRLRRSALIGEGYLATSQRIHQIDEQIADFKRKQKILETPSKRKPTPAPRPKTRPTPKPKN